MRQSTISITGIVGILAITLGVLQPYHSFLLYLGITVVFVGIIGILMLKLKHPSFYLAVGSALAVAFAMAYIHQAHTILLDGQFVLVQPSDVESLALVFTCWGVAMAFALGLASGWRTQWVATALASFATVPLLGALVRANQYQNPNIAPDYLYPIALIVGFGLWAAIPLFQLGTAIGREPEEGSRMRRPIALIAGVVCALQLLVLLTAAMRYLPPLLTISGVTFALFTVGPVVYISSWMGLAWGRSQQARI